MKETWNPAEISEDIKPVNYVNADSWNAAELNEAINLFGIKYPSDTWNPAELDEKARNIINDITSTRTITGNPISFKTINGGYAKSCEISFSPIQSGSGDPSPSNVRPISGWTELHLYQSDESTTTPDKTTTATLGSTYYGGKYDFVSGDGFETISDKVDLGSLTWRKATGYFYSSISSLTPPKRPNTDNVPFVGNCESYKVSYLNDTADGIITMNRTGNAQIYIRDIERSEYTEEEFKEFLSGKYWCYELATPTTISTSAEEIELLKGQNVLWTDGDDIELKYTKLALPDDSDGLSLNQKVRKAIEIIKGKAIKEETKESTKKGRRKKL